MFDNVPSLERSCLWKVLCSNIGIAGSLYKFMLSLKSRRPMIFFLPKYQVLATSISSISTSTRRYFFRHGPIFEN